MKKAWKIFRGIVVVLAVLLVATPISLYVILSSGWAQNDIRRVAVQELSAILGTDVSIGEVEIHPFYHLSIYDISARDDNDRPALKIKEISVAFELFYLLRTGKIVVDFALVNEPDLKLYRQHRDSPLNIAGIINALKSDRPREKQSKYDLRANTVIIRNGILNYDVLDAQKRDSVFDINHIAVDRVCLNAYIPTISNDEHSVEIERFSFHEKNGFTLEKLECTASLTSHGSSIEGLSLSLPHSTLNFNTVKIDNQSISDIERIFKSQGIEIGISEGSNIYLPDLAAFAPALANLTDDIDISLSGRLSATDAHIESLKAIESDGKYGLSLKASAENINKGTEATLSVDELKVSANSSGLRDIAGLIKDRRTGSKIDKLLKEGNSLTATLKSKGRISDSKIAANIRYGDNSLKINGGYSSHDSLRTIRFKADGMCEFDDLAMVDPSLSQTSFRTRFKTAGRVAGKSSQGEISLDSARIAYKGYCYSGISLTASAGRQKAEGKLSVDDPMLKLQAECLADYSEAAKSIEATIEVDKAYPDSLHLIKGYPGYMLSGQADGIFEFTDINDISGSLSLRDLSFKDSISATADLEIKKLDIDAVPGGDAPGIMIESDFLNGYVNGRYHATSLYPMLKDLAAKVFPAIDNGEVKTTFKSEDYENNNFTFDFKLSECENLCKFAHLPVSIIHPIGIKGHFSGVSQTASLTVDAPYMLHGDKIIESTAVRASIDADEDYASVYATSKMPTKKGPMVVVANLSGASDRIDNRIDWVIERKIPINGSFNFSTELFRDEDDGSLFTNIIFNPGTINFGDDVWTIKPSSIGLADKRIDIDKFAMEAGDKSILIDGTVSDSEDDRLTVDLKNIALLEIFETLEIDKALIGGSATGRFIGSNLLTAEPAINCKRLHVDSISYNRCVLGDADIAAHWDNTKKSFFLDADITGDDGLHSRIYGDIFPAGEALDINFDANHVPVGFLKPFMSAFASEIKGYASGHARLFGTFKYIDMTGDLFADNLKIKIDFTNTWYTATDSIKLQPGLIDINDVTIKDINGNTAKLNGFVRHKFFKEPSFNFKVSDARNFLSYNVDAKLSPDWYGTVYGNGGATISGEPGVVDISVEMSTAPKSIFTFVLSDRLDADEYSFITFKDSRAEAIRDSLSAHDDTPPIVRMLRERLGMQDSDSQSAYNMDLQIDITPDARMVLVMDPVAGDQIKANGSGNLKLTYESLNNDLRMYGTYTLDHGSYNFTLQDIIIKDFTIKEGSSIAFHGDPYSAQLAIQAVYAVNANLSDLDESFLLDKDLNRTNVPVHALLKVTGDMRQPDIDFDLEFPTLTQDTYRKVRSIVSTKEMMNRQIIYLLALNRFYTPDYMASTTKGNELFSVASSTIASQLSSMLGKLSDDWSIAPNLRSERGDFSDVEVDVALSSRLLNNRLLFNGNFGYRDKTLNTNQFIGDFDIEYLLNPKGSWRLKAYNRYNDQNYYVRTAQTTQGVGIVFKKDFNNFFGFLRPKKKAAKAAKPDGTKLKGDSTLRQPTIVIPDSIAHPANPLLEQ